MNLIEKTKKKVKFFLDHMQDGNLTLTLKIGEVIEGEVIEPPGCKMTAIRFNGSPLLVESRPELQLGDRILVKVIKLEPEVICRLIFRKNKRSESIEIKA